MYCVFVIVYVIGYVDEDCCVQGYQYIGVQVGGMLLVLVFQFDQVIQDEGGGEVDGGVEQGFEIDVGDDLYGIFGMFMGLYEGWVV